jgi:hypothetical protein
LNTRIADIIFETTHTHYARDAQGNVMAVYDLNMDNQEATLSELNMYGSSRLGTRHPDLNLATINPSNNFYLIRGKKQYKFTNHLGNVLSTISDHRVPVYVSGVAQGFVAQTRSAQDYYPFSMTMPGRRFNGLIEDSQGDERKESNLPTPPQ